MSRRAWRRALMVGAVVAAAVAALSVRPPATMSQLETGVMDVMLRQGAPAATSGRVVIVDVDERSLGEVGRWPWPRAELARLLGAVRAGEPTAVAVGMMFPERETADGDRRLGEALREGPFAIGYAFTFDEPAPSAGPPCPLRPVGLAVPGTERDAVRSGGFFRATGVLCNVAPIGASARAAGFLNATADRDGLLRRVPVLIEHGGQLHASLPLAAVLASRRDPMVALVARPDGRVTLDLDGRAIPLDASGNLLVRFRERGQFPVVSAAEVLAGGAAAREALRGRIAIVGISALGVEQRVATPLDPHLPAAEVQATVIDNLLQGDALARPPWARALEVALVALLALGAAVLLHSRRSAVGMLVASLAAFGLWVGLWAACAWALRWRGVVLSPLYPTLALGGSFVVVTALDVVLERRRAEAVLRQLRTAWRGLLDAVTALGALRRQRRRLARALRASEARYQELFEGAPVGLYRCAPGGQLLDVNQALQRILRYPSREALLAINVADVEVEAADRGPTGRATDERLWRCADGGTVWVKAIERELRDERGRLVGRQGAVEDVTDRRRAEEARERLEGQLREAQKMEALGRLAGGVAHDFNNLLTVIAGRTQLVLTGAIPGPAVRHQVEVIHEASRRAAELTKQLLAFSRRQTLQPRVVDVNGLLREAHRVLARLLREDIALEIGYGESLKRVRADPSQFHQIILNLVVNARDAMPTGGRLTVTTGTAEVDAPFVARHPGLRPGPYVVMAVRDTGTGMDARTAANCFEPFYTTKEPGRGTGLGLSTVYGIVQQHEGCVEVATAPGEGTTFTVYLPAVDAQADPERPPVALAPGGQERILLVEDEAAVRRVTCDILQALGFSVVAAEGGAAALRLLDAERPKVDLLLTDVIMPGLSGREVAREIRQRYPGLPVVYMSGYTEDVLAQHELEGVGAAVLEKPFSPEALLRAIRAALDARAEGR